MTKPLWQRLEISDEAVAHDLALLKQVPPDLVTLYKNQKDDGAEVIQACLLLLKKEPTQATALMFLAQIYMQRQDYVRCLRYARKLTTLTPCFYVGWQLRGMCELRLHKVPQGRNSFLALARLKPTDCFAYACVAISFYIQGKSTMALMLLNLFIDEQPIEDKQFLVWLKAYITEKQGNIDDALIHYIESQLMTPSEKRDWEVGHKIHELTMERRARKERSEDIDVGDL